MSRPDESTSPQTGNADRTPDGPDAGRDRTPEAADAGRDRTRADKGPAAGKKAAGAHQPARWQDDDWDRGSWDRDDWDRDDWDRGRPRDGKAGAPGPTDDGAPAEPGESSLSEGRPLGYTAPGPDSPARRPAASPAGRLDKGHQVAFMLLAGIGLGAGIGYGIDRLVGTFPALMLVGVFAGFAVALYAVFIETR